MELINNLHTWHDFCIISTLTRVGSGYKDKQGKDRKLVEGGRGMVVGMEWHNELGSGPQC